MSTTIVHLVRHGEVHNPERVLYGRLPGFRLSARGESQAARTAQAFEGHDVTHLACSPLQRTRQTALPMACVTGLEPQVDESLIEAGNRFEGLRTKGWRTQLINPVRWPLMVDPSEPSWGEPYRDIQSRMLDAVERARLAAEGHEAVLVTHQLPIVTVQRWVAGLDVAHMPWDRRCELASVTSLVFRGAAVAECVYTEPAQEI
ncbi:histidine phosphatase family protein [Corynebacterium frankenforstense]|uniref:histidine phosphatase family protein n=1 Tax=Corynebacterium TaxID=1716 RepID=UPI00254FB5BF|nr:MULTISPECIES: histidine phosphatase family protein [Corynebacterium]MDK6260468.1 histidine phosphatase family protein [Corynebacterium frankenforstense]MDK8895871.1 histidine phosphatase family protein [Corynebacterium sp. MSK006]